MAENIPPTPLVLPVHNYYVAQPGAITTVVPTAQDVVAAEKFKVRVIAQGDERHRAPKVEAIADAIKYAHKVTGADAQPPWAAALLTTLQTRIEETMTQKFTDMELRLQAALTRELNNMETRLQATNRELHQKVDDVERKVNDVERKVNVIDRKVDEIDRKLKKVSDLATASYIMGVRRKNAQVNDVDGFEEVPFPDGTFPWNHEVDGTNGTRFALAKLDSIQAFRNLSAAQTTAYYKGYYPNEAVPPRSDERKLGILAAIGRRMDALLGLI